MKKYTKLIILGAILVAACIAVFVIKGIKEHSEKINSTEDTILTIDSSDVTSLSWDYDGADLAFHKDTDNSTDDETIWLYDEDDAFPVDTEKVNELLDNFSEFETAFTIDDVEDYGQYGLDNPMCTVTIEAGDTTYSVEFGDYSAMDSERYVSIGDGKVYLAKDDPTDSFNIELADMIKNDELPDFDDVTDIQFTGNADYTIYSDDTATLSCCADDIYFTDIDGTAKPLDTEKVTNILGYISGLDESEYVTYNATEDEIAEYGLDEPEMSAVINYVQKDDSEDDDSEGTAETFTLSISRSAEDKAAIDEAAASGESVDSDSYDGYVRIGQSKIIYKISASDFTALMGISYDDLRHNELFTADWDQVSSIDVIIGDETYTFTTEAPSEDTESSEETTEETTTSSSSDDSTDKVFYYNGEEVDLTTVETALKALSVDEFTSAAADQQEEISLTIHLNNENFSEVKITLYRYDGSYCRSEVDGEMIGLAARSGVVNLVEAVNAIVLN